MLSGTAIPLMVMKLMRSPEAIVLLSPTLQPKPTSCMQSNRGFNLMSRMLVEDIQSRLDLLSHRQASGHTTTAPLHHAHILDFVRIRLVVVLRWADDIHRISSSFKSPPVCQPRAQQGRRSQSENGSTCLSSINHRRDNAQSTLSSAYVVD